VQIDLLLRHARCDRLVLAYDNDEAGRAITQVSIRRLSATYFGSRLYVARYPGKDPGDLQNTRELVLRPWNRTLLSP
jgi:DNA primase